MSTTGSNMQTADYQTLKNFPYVKILSDDEAKMLINRLFGFEIGSIQLINKAGHNVSKDRYLRIQDENRPPLYATDNWNYIRFDTRRFYYELVNGKLYCYWC